MSLLTEATALGQIEKAKTRHRSHEELEIRTALESWGRAKHPEARQCHELVVGQGQGRADLAFVEPNDLIAMEIKSSWDSSDRLMLQAAMFSLVAPVVWLCIAPDHTRDAELVRYLLPHLGLMHAVPVNANGERLPRGYPVCPVRIEVIHEPVRRVPHPESMMALCWRDELAHEAQHARLIQGKSRITHRGLVELLVEHLTPAEQMAAVCRQLRGRNAFWRADPPLAAAPNATGQADDAREGK